MEAIAEKSITEAEYWKLEAVSEIKHEYFNGRIYAMAGDTATHNANSSNFLAHLERVTDFVRL